MLITADRKDGTRGLKTRLTVAGTVVFFFFKGRVKAVVGVVVFRHL